jgi:hypothetical protein
MGFHMLKKRNGVFADNIVQCRKVGGILVIVVLKASTTSWLGDEVNGELLYFTVGLCPKIALFAGGEL